MDRVVSADIDRVKEVVYAVLPLIFLAVDDDPSYALWNAVLLVRCPVVGLAACGLGQLGNE